MAKPKVYRKTKTSSPSNIATYKINEGGGPVEGIIIGPESSTGTVSTFPKVEQGKEKDIKLP